MTYRNKQKARSRRWTDRALGNGENRETGEGSQDSGSHEFESQNRPDWRRLETAHLKDVAKRSENMNLAAPAIVGQEELRSSDRQGPIYKRDRATATREAGVCGVEDHELVLFLPVTHEEQWWS